MNDDLLAIQNVLNEIDTSGCAIGIVDTTPAYSALVRIRAEHERLAELAWRYEDLSS